MPFEFDGANDITLADIEEFLESDGDTTPVSNGTDETSPAAQQDTEEHEAETPAEAKPVNETQAFAHRLKEQTEKALAKERASIAKELGYDSYDELRKAREKRMLEESGIDPEDATPVIDRIIEKRLADDPRMKAAEEARKREMIEWAKKELANLSERTGKSFKTMSDLPPEVRTMWEEKGSLTGAYMYYYGDTLTREAGINAASEQSKGSTSHLSTPAAQPNARAVAGRRPLTEQEKAMYRFFNPSVSEEALSKMTKQD